MRTAEADQGKQSDSRSDWQLLRETHEHTERRWRNNETENQRHEAAYQCSTAGREGAVIIVMTFKDIEHYIKRGREHTFSIKTNERPTPCFLDYRGRGVTTTAFMGKKETYNILINPEKVKTFIDDRLGFDPHSMQGAKQMGEFVASLKNIEEYKFKRFDFRWDLPSKDSNEEMEVYFDRLCHVEIVCYGAIRPRGSKHGRESNDLETGDFAYVEAPHDNSYRNMTMTEYNKGIQDDTGLIARRLELRSTRKAKGYQEPKKFMNAWLEKLENLPAYYKQAAHQDGQILIKKWRKYVETCKDKTEPKLTSFLAARRDSIYNREQLRYIFDRLGDKNPERATKRFCDRYPIINISERDLQKFVDMQLRDIRAYLEKPSGLDNATPLIFGVSERNARHLQSVEEQGFADIA